MSILCIAANHSHETVVNSIRLRLANATLAERNARSAEKAEQANRDKSDFLAAASHDLRQPVHALLLFVEALRQHQLSAAVPHDQRTGSQVQTALVGQIATAGQAISTMFNELMELSRLESGSEQARMHPVAMVPLLQQCVDSLQLQSHQKPLRLRAGGRLELAVRDTGIGTDTAQHERIFEPYMQVGNPERDRSKGLGLGLAIVRQCLHLLDLPLHMRSRLGQGSCFWIEFRQWRNAELQTAQVALPDPRAVRSLAGRRIPLIDDDAMVRDALQTVLGSWDIDLHVVPAVGNNVLDELPRRDWRPDCILCDYRMPGPRNGIHVLDDLLEVLPQAIGVLQTGERAERVQAEADDAGYVVLYKPVTAAALASTLAAVLHSTGTAPLMPLAPELSACTS